MATATFEKKIVLGKEATEILAAEMMKEEPVSRPVIDNIKNADKEFIEKCIQAWHYKK